MITPRPLRIRLLVGVGALALVSTACGVAGAQSEVGPMNDTSASATTQASLELSATLPAADLAARVYFDEEEHWTAERAIQQCMNSSGFEYELAPYFPVDIIRLDGRYGPTKEQQAVAANDRHEDETALNPTFATLDEAGRDAWSAAFFGGDDLIVWIQVGDRRSGRPAGGCLEKGLEAAVGDVDLWVETRELIEDLFRDSKAAAEKDPRVQDALAQWSACMRSSGYPTIATLEDMEHVQGDDLLLAGVRCNNAVGLATSWFLVETEVQLALLGERGAMLESMLAGTSLGR